jgi:hypothetical protein
MTSFLGKRGKLFSLRVTILVNLSRVAQGKTHNLTFGKIEPLLTMLLLSCSLEM